MADDDLTPASSTDGGQVSSGFTAFDDSQRRAEQRAKRKSLAGKTIAGVAVLGLVAAVAALTGGHSKSTVSPAAAGAPRPGTVVKPKPPEVLFVSAELGYAFYRECDSQPNGDGCQAALYKTVNGGVKWTPITLPGNAPVDPSSWLPPQARGDQLVLAWQGGIAVSQAQGADFKPVKVDELSSTSQLTKKDFLVAGPSQLIVVDPDALSGVVFRQPEKVQLSGAFGGQLADGQVWVSDGSGIGISAAGDGLQWNTNPVAGDGETGAPMADKNGDLARLTGFSKDKTTGWPGDGASLKPSHVLFSTNQGADWTPSASLTGPADNALCTVYLDDGSLLGVGTDRSSLLTLKKGTSVFAKAVVTGLADVPSCLSSRHDLVWGPTQAKGSVLGKLAISTDGGKTWTMRSLPTSPYGTAMPSPKPSAK